VISLEAGVKFPRWVPKDAQVAVTDLYEAISDDPECRYMLQRIATRDPMQEVWAQQFKKISPSLLVGLTVLTYLSATRDRSVKKSVSKAMRQKSRSEPTFDIAWQARAVANAVKAIHPEILDDNEITEVTQRELDRVAAFFERENDKIRSWNKFVPLPRKVGARNANQIAFVNHLCDVLWSHIGPPRRPYSLVAILTNVAFDVPEREEWDADRVKHCYRSRSRSK
jgi:hypothetical protein